MFAHVCGLRVINSLVLSPTPLLQQFTPGILSSHLRPFNLTVLDELTITPSSVFRLNILSKSPYYALITILN